MSPFSFDEYFHPFRFTYNVNKLRHAYSEVSKELDQRLSGQMNDPNPDLSDATMGELLRILHGIFSWMAAIMSIERAIWTDIRYGSQT